MGDIRLNTIGFSEGLPVFESPQGLPWSCRHGGAMVG